MRNMYVSLMFGSIWETVDEHETVDKQETVVQLVPNFSRDVFVSVDQA